MIDLDAFGMVPKDILMAITSNEKARRKQLGVTLQELARKKARFLFPPLLISQYILESRNAFGIYIPDKNTNQRMSF